VPSHKKRDVLSLPPTLEEYRSRIEPHLTRPLTWGPIKRKPRHDQPLEYQGLSELATMSIRASKSQSK
jgi:hypothetical protein